MRKFRTFLFWCHLIVGATVGLVVLMMSITGLLLTYERQILRALDDGAETSGRPMLSADLLIGKTLQEAGRGADTPVSLRLSPDADTPILARIGRNAQYLLDPGTGEVLREGPSGLAAFFATVTRIHRWFALEGESRAFGRAVTGWSNIGFLFLLVSGTYLWLPRIWNWPQLQSHMLLKRRYATTKARDWAWHHVFSFWAAIPLLFIICTASVFYFPWANALVYGVYGEPVPERRAPTDAVNADEPAPFMTTRADDNAVQSLLTEGLALAENGGIDWRTLTVEASLVPGTPVTLAFDTSLGGQPQSVSTLTFDESGSGTWTTLADRSPGTRARFIIRFLHTGEVLGPIGQTVAGAASLAAALLVWTGLALAWRRLITPVLRRRTSSRKSPA